MGNLSNENYLVVDLSAGESSEEMLDEGFFTENIGGAAANLALYKQFEADDPVILGTGLLTGSMVPGSAAGIITAKSPRTGKVCHAAFNLWGGSELKYTGFDYVVIKGASAKPVCLWIHDQMADINDASNLWGKTAWETTDALRYSLGEDLIQNLTIGPAGEKGSDLAQVVLNYWATEDRWGFGALFGQKNLKSVAMRGMGLMEIAGEDDFVEACIGIVDEFKSSPIAGKQGISDISAALGEDITEWLAPKLHRHSACYNTSYPTNTFLKLDEDPKIMKETKVEEPGVLITNIEDIMGFKKMGLSVEDAGRALQACLKSGVDPVAAAELCQKNGKTSLGDIKGALSSLSGPADSTGSGTMSPCFPEKSLFTDEGSGAEWQQRRLAVAHILGIQPLFALMSPFLPEEKLIELVNLGTDLGITADQLNNAVNAVLGG